MKKITTKKVTITDQQKGTFLSSRGPIKLTETATQHALNEIRTWVSSTPPGVPPHLVFRSIRATGDLTITPPNGWSGEADAKRFTWRPFQAVEFGFGKKPEHYLIGQHLEIYTRREFYKSGLTGGGGTFLTPEKITEGVFVWALGKDGYFSDQEEGSSFHFKRFDLVTTPNQVFSDPSIKKLYTFKGKTQFPDGFPAAMVLEIFLYEKPWTIF